MHADLRRVGEAYGAQTTMVDDRAITTAHPMGGAAIANTPTEGVVDHTGEVFGRPGLFVADGAAYPAPPGVPPVPTIAAPAERQAEIIAAGLGS